MLVGVVGSARHVVFVGAAVLMKLRNGSANDVGCCASLFFQNVMHRHNDHRVQIEFNIRLLQTHTGSGY
jgi:hypothetical protein